MADRLALMFDTPISEWHRWFAWRPVDTADRGIVWLRFIWRRRMQLKWQLPGVDRWFQYAVAPETEEQQ